MNNEIKEILERVKKHYVLDEIQDNLLLNYITNLQQENERLKELVNPKTQIFIDTQDMEERYGEELYKEYLEKQVKDYKSRIEKAVEYLKFEWEEILNNENYKNHMWTVDGLVIKTIIDVLNGRSDE